MVILERAPQLFGSHQLLEFFRKRQSFIDDEEIWDRWGGPFEYKAIQRLTLQTSQLTESQLLEVKGLVGEVVDLEDAPKKFDLVL